MMKQLSIIIAHRNDWLRLGQTLGSIMATCPPADVELIVIDDASDTGPPKVAGLDAHLFGEWPARSYVDHAERRGHAYCRNVGAAIAQGDWLMLTDAHMIFTAGWWERFRSTAARAPSNAIFCGPYFSCDPAGNVASIIDGARFFFWECDKGPLDCVSIKPLPHQAIEPAHDVDGLREVPAPIGANYFMRRDWFDAIGGLPGLVGWSIDEWLLAVKTRLAGGCVLLDPHLQIRHINDCTAQAGHFGSLAPFVKKGMSKAELIYNKLAMAYQVLSPSEWAAFLQGWPVAHNEPTMAAALELFETMRGELDLARDHINAQAWPHGTDWLCAEFDLNHPADIGAAVA